MKRRCILCVDDERMILTGIKAQLRGQFERQVAIEVAESGEEGLEVLEELVEDGVDVPVVISDQLMPGMKGEEFLAAVHQRNPRIRTILLTGQATAEAVGAAVNTARLYRFLSKPWTEADLLMTVREAIRAYDAALALAAREAELAAARAAALRFVPRDFLRLLGRDDVEDVLPGDETVREVTILFTDLAGYTPLLERAGREVAARSVHAFLDRMEALVHTHGGFVNNLEGDAVLALFPRDPADAVRCGQAAFRMLDALNAEHRARDLPTLGMGVGVATGPLRLTVLGGDERLQCDLVGAAVNEAVALESLTRGRGVPFLLAPSTALALALADQPAMVRSRRGDGVDCFEVRGDRSGATEGA